MGTSRRGRATLSAISWEIFCNPRILKLGLSRKDPCTLPPRRKFLPSREGGEIKLFLIIVNVLGHQKGVGGLTFNFLRGGGMDVFWNDPFLSAWNDGIN